MSARAIPHLAAAPVVRTAVLHLLLAAVAPGCGDEEAPKARVSLVPANVRPDQIMARVDGIPILRADLIAQMRGGQRRDDALKALIQREVLAQEARRRGFDRDPRVLKARARSMANVLVRREFRSHFTKKEVPRELIEAAYKLNRTRYVHEELVRVLHIIAVAGEGLSAEHHKKAGHLAQQVRAIAASGPLSPKEFKEIALLVDKENTTVTVRAEGPFISARGPPARLAPDFLAAAFKLHKPGEVSPVLRTSFGYHVIYLEARIAPRNDPLEQVEGEIRARIFEQARKQAFDRWVEQLAQAHRVKLVGGGSAAAGGAWR